MRFQKRKNYKRKRSKWGKPEPTPALGGLDGHLPSVAPGDQRVGVALSPL